MKAMILAAGLGTRLRPWTLYHPKALVPVDGVPMLERVIERLKSFGYDDFVINIHHFGGQIIDFLGSRDFKARIRVSDEREMLLDTGGGLLAASRILMEGDAEPFLVHNADILSNADLRLFMERHLASGNDVSLLVSDRESSRKLLLDDDYRLRGWHNLTTGEFRPSKVGSASGPKERAFSGIYIIGKKGVEALKGYSIEKGLVSFPVMDFFLTFPDGVRIGGYEATDLRLLDIGKPAALQQAESFLRLLS